MLNEPSAVVILMPRSTGYTSLGSGIGQGTVVFAEPSILQVGRITAVSGGGSEIWIGGEFVTCLCKAFLSGGRRSTLKLRPHPGIHA
jgi:hypothetical protein